MILAFPIAIEFLVRQPPESGRHMLDVCRVRRKRSELATQRLFVMEEVGKQGNQQEEAENMRKKVESGTKSEAQQDEEMESNDDKPLDINEHYVVRKQDDSWCKKNHNLKNIDFLVLEHNQRFFW